MSNRSPVTTEDGVPSGSATPLTPGTIVAGLAPYYNIAPGIVFPAPHAASHAAGGTDPVVGPLALKASTAAPNTAPLKIASGPLLTAPEAGAVEFLTDKFYGTITTGTARKEIALTDTALTSGRIPFTTTNGRLADTANLTRDSVTGNITVADGANLIMSGANALGEGCVVFAAAASAAYDSNLCITDSQTKTMGYVCGPTAAFVGSSGPFFGMRGNTYTALANQRGNLFFFAGRPTAPGANEGRVIFGTNDTERGYITLAGLVYFSNMTVSDLAAGKPVYTTTNGRLTTTPQGQYSAIATKTANYTLTPTDCVIIGDTTSGSFTLTLPTAVGYSGLTFTLKSSSAANVLSFATTSGQTVDGATTGPIPYPNAIKVISDGANWHVI